MPEYALNLADLVIGRSGGLNGLGSQPVFAALAKVGPRRTAF